MILSGKEDFDAGQMESIASMDHLKDCFNQRWYEEGDQDTYFMFYNNTMETIKKGE